MLPPSARLSRRAQFAEVVRRGSRAGTPTLVAHLIVTPGAGSDGPRRAGFVVSRSVGPAVTRNRVRRQLRHLVAARLGAMPAGAQLVIRATPAAAGLPSRQLADDLDRALTRATRGTSAAAIGASQ